VTAAEAMKLPSARPEKSDLEDCRMMLAKLHEHIRTHMTFGGPTPIEVPFRELSRIGAQILCYAMKHSRWTVNANLIAEAPRFNGGQPVPHHWVLQLQPMMDVYDDLLAEILPPLTEKPLLDA
jgi:hypothetical protein